MKSTSRNFNKSAKKFIACYTYGKKGQKSTECFKNSNKRCFSNCKFSTHTDNTYQKLKDKANKTYDDFTDEHSNVFKIDDNYLQLLCKETFLVDCGATTHIINNESNLLGFDGSFDLTKHFIKLANGEKSNNVAKKWVTSVIYLHSADNGLVKIFLKNTLLVFLIGIHSMQG